MKSDWFRTAVVAVWLGISVSVGWTQDIESLAKHWKLLLEGKKPRTTVIAYWPQTRPATVFMLKV